MKDQKPGDQNTQKEQETGQQITKPVEPTNDIQTNLHDEGQLQKPGSSEDQNTRSANNDTIGIP